MSNKGLASKIPADLLEMTPHIVYIDKMTGTYNERNVANQEKDGVFIAGGGENAAIAARNITKSDEGGGGSKSSSGAGQTIKQYFCCYCCSPTCNWWIQNPNSCWPARIVMLLKPLSLQQALGITGSVKDLERIIIDLARTATKKVQEKRYFEGGYAAMLVISICRCAYNLACDGLMKLNTEYPNINTIAELMKYIIHQGVEERAKFDPWSTTPKPPSVEAQNSYVTPYWNLKRADGNEVAFHEMLARRFYVAMALRGQVPDIEDKDKNRKRLESISMEVWNFGIKAAYAKRHEVKDVDKDRDKKEFKVYLESSIDELEKVLKEEKKAAKGGKDAKKLWKGAKPSDKQASLEAQIKRAKEVRNSFDVNSSKYAHVSYTTNCGFRGAIPPDPRQNPNYLVGGGEGSRSGMTDNTSSEQRKRDEARQAAEEKKKQEGEENIRQQKEKEEKERKARENAKYPARDFDWANTDDQERMKRLRPTAAVPWTLANGKNSTQYFAIDGDQRYRLLSENNVKTFSFKETFLSLKIIFTASSDSEMKSIVDEFKTKADTHGEFMTRNGVWCYTLSVKNGRITASYDDLTDGQYTKSWLLRFLEWTFNNWDFSSNDPGKWSYTMPPVTKP